MSDETIIVPADTLFGFVVRPGKDADHGHVEIFESGLPMIVAARLCLDTALKLFAETGLSQDETVLEIYDALIRRNVTEDPKGIEATP